MSSTYMGLVAGVEVVVNILIEVECCAYEGNVENIVEIEEAFLRSDSRCEDLDIDC